MDFDRRVRRRERILAVAAARRAIQRLEGETVGASATRARHDHACLQAKALDDAASVARGPRMVGCSAMAFR